MGYIASIKMFFWPPKSHRNRNENLIRNNCEPLKCLFLARSVRHGGCSSLVSSGRCHPLLSFTPTSEMNGRVSLGATESKESKPCFLSF